MGFESNTWWVSNKMKATMAVPLFTDFNLDLSDKDHELVNFEDFWL